MKTHKEMLEVEVPDGYKAVEVRAPKKNDTFIHRFSGHVDVFEAASDFEDREHRVIVEKTHKEPELLHCLQTLNSLFSRVGVDAKITEELLLLNREGSCDKYTWEGRSYDLILRKTKCGGYSIWLGHWNDGV